MDCLKCGQPVPASPGPGRPSRYCSKGCRRAAEYELRRLASRIASAELRLASLTRDEAVGPAYGSPEHRRKCLAWAQNELKGLEARLAALLDDAPEVSHAE